MIRVALYIILLLGACFAPRPSYNGHEVKQSFWGAIIGLATQGISMLLSRKKKKEAGEDTSSIPLSPEEQAAIQMLTQTGQMSMDQASQMFGISTELLDQSQAAFQGATEDLGGARDYFNKLMTGDTATRAEFFAPETQKIEDTYSQAFEQARRFGGEGGETDRMKSDLRAAKTGELARLFSSARPAAAEGLMRTAQVGAGIGGELANAGTSMANSGVNALGVATSAAGNIFRPFEAARSDQTARRGQNIGIWSDIGKGVGGILADIYKNRKAATVANT